MINKDYEYNKNKIKMPLQRKLFIISLITIPIIHFLLFYVYVNFNAFIMAFQKNIKGETVWTFDHFIKIYELISKPQNDIKLMFANTFKTFLINVLMYPVSILVSYFLYKKIRLYNLFRTLFYLPMIISGVVYGFVYIQFVSSRGPIPELVQRLWKLSYKPTLLADTKFANLFVWIQMMWLSFPGAMIIWGGTFSRIPESVIEYAKLDGVGWIREMFQIILPMVWPTFSLFMVLLLAGIFSSTGNVFLLTQGQFDTQTLSFWFYYQVYGVSVRPGSNTFNYMSAFGLCLTIVACSVSLITRKYLVKLVPDVEY